MIFVLMNLKIHQGWLTLGQETNALRLKLAIPTGQGNPS